MASSRTWGIIAALALAAGLVVAAWLFSNVSRNATRPPAVSAASTDALLQEIASKDSDGDGLPDWEEALYGTDPKRVDSDSDGILDGEAARRGLLSPTSVPEQTTPGTPETPSPAPDSITDRFARSLFENYIQAGGGKLSTEGKRALEAALIVEFTNIARAMTSSSYTLGAVTTSKTDVVSYARSVALVVKAHDRTGKTFDPVALLEEVVKDENAPAKEKLEATAKESAAIAEELLLVSVPNALAQNHLVLVRSFETIAKTVAQFKDAGEDPLGTLVAIRLYRDASASLLQTMGVVRSALVAEFGVPERGTPEYLFVITGASNL